MFAATRASLTFAQNAKRLSRLAQGRRPATPPGGWFGARTEWRKRGRDRNDAQMTTVGTGLRSQERPRLRVGRLCRLIAASLTFALVVLLLSAAVAAAPAAAHSIIVVAPHPDDDLLYGAGLVSRALSVGDSVKVVYMTNGDVDGIASGYAREDEAVAGQAVLTTPENDLIFLGYPDTGLQALFEDYADPGSAFTGAASGAYQTYGDRGLGRSDYHYYRFGFHADYNKPDVVGDLDAIIAAYRPDDIYTTGPLDIHSDHATTYQFVKLALLRAMAADPTYDPTLHSTIVHTDDQADWPEAIDPTTPMTEPPGLPASGPQSWSTWEHLSVPTAMRSTNENTNPKIQAIAKHVSQGGTDDFLGQFVHSDEIFWPETLTLPANIGPLATATASSASPDQTADKAIDGVVDGSGGSPGDYSKEWASNHEKTGAWLTSTWPAPVWIDHIVLYDRPNANDQITAGTLTFSDGSNVSTGSLPNDGSAKTITFTPRAESSVTLAVTAVSTLTTSVGLAEMQVDRVLPPTGSFAIGSGAQYSTSTAVTLNNSISDDTAMQMRFVNGSDFTGVAWETYSATRSWTLVSGDGTKTVSAQFKDAAGNVDVTSDTIVLDTTPPAGTVAIDGAAPYTNSTAATLNNAIGDLSGVSQMRFADGSGAGIGAWSGCEAYAATRSWTLPGGDGPKTVSAQFKDVAGNISATIISSAITLDTTPPSGGFSIDAGAQSTNTMAVTLDNSAITDASGVTKMRFANGSDASGATWVAYSAATTWTLPGGDGSKTVAAQFQDAAGNVHTTTDTITLDTTSPSGTFVITGNPDAVATYTDTPTVTLTSSVSAGGAMAQMRFANGTDTMGAWEPYAATKSWTLSAGDGSKTVAAQFKSAAGNVYATSNTITLDTVAPTISAAAPATWQKGPRDRPPDHRRHHLGVAQAQYRLQGSATWLVATGDAFTVKSNTDSTYEYRALDKAGNASALQSVTVRIDTTRPTTTAPSAARVRRGGWVTLKFRINDTSPETGKATVTLKIKTWAGKTVKTVVLKAQRVNTLLGYRFRCTLKRGAYRFSVAATDASVTGQEGGHQSA